MGRRVRICHVAKNAHLKRLNPSVDLLIKGGKGSKLMEKAFPLAEDSNPLAVRKSLRSIICTSTGKRIQDGAPWFRWTLTCNKCQELIDMINMHQETLY